MTGQDGPNISPKGSMMLFDAADAGVGGLIRIERAQDVRGKPIS